MKPNSFRFTLVIVTVAFALTGCLKSADNTTPQTPPTYISIMQLAPTVPPMDIFFNTTKVSTAAFTPYTVTPAYNPIEKGDYSISFKKTSSDSVVANIPLATYDPENYYTLLIYNQSAGGPANAVRIKDDFTALTNDKAYFRFFHASPNTGAVDLYIDNVKVQSNRLLGDNSGFDLMNKFTAIDPGSGHMMQVKEAGTDTVIATLTHFELLTGNAYTFYLKGLTGGTGADELTIGNLRAN